MSYNVLKTELTRRGVLSGQLFARANQLPLLVVPRSVVQAV